jgi:hypothetical protein
VLRVTKNKLTLVVPPHWIDSRGFLKVPAIYALKLFFGDITLKEALVGAGKKWQYRWTIKEVKDETR